MMGHIPWKGEEFAKQFLGMSQRGNPEEAVRELRRPQFMMLLSNDRQFEDHVRELEKRDPGVPGIGFAVFRPSGGLRAGTRGRAPHFKNRRSSALCPPV